MSTLYFMKVDNVSFSFQILGLFLGVPWQQDQREHHLPGHRGAIVEHSLPLQQRCSHPLRPQEGLEGQEQEAHAPLREPHQKNGVHDQGQVRPSLIMNCLKR